MSDAARKGKSKRSTSASTGEEYKPGPEFEEDSKDPLVDISSSDSTELWLIQWPLNQLQPSDFNGKELTLKLHRDGKLGGFVSASGKSYDLVSFAAHEPDATVFQPSQSETKIVGKISRRVSLIHYPEPGEMEKPRFILSSQKSEGSALRSIHRSSATSLRHGNLFGKAASHNTMASAYAPEVTTEISPESRNRKHNGRIASAEVPARSTGLLSHASASDNNITNNSLTSEQSHGVKSKKKKVKVEQW